MHRRRFIQTAAVLPAVFMATRGHAFAEATASIIWSVPRNQVPAVRDTLDFSGTVTPDATSAPNTRALPLLFIFIGVASIPSLVSTLASVYKDIRYGGVVVTARDGRFQIMNDPHLSG